jgi:transposase
MQAKQAANHYPYSRESLRALDPEAVIDMLLALDARYNQLADYTRELVTNKYGHKSERFKNPGQLLIFPGIDTTASDSSSTDEAASPASAEQTTPKSHAKPKKPGHTKNPLPTDLPKVPVFAPQPENTKLPCTCCGTARVPVRQILQSSRYQFIPAKFYIEELYSIAWGCQNCHSNDEIITRVHEVVENGIAAPELLAQVAVARDFDHQPFNRQSSIYSRSGVNLNRSTLSDFYAQVAKILLPLYNFMHLILLQSKIISTDDTPVKVLDRSKDKNIKTGRKWIYMGDKDHPVNLFDYTHSRGRDGPLTFLSGFKGFLQGDCFSGNLAVCAAAGTILVACLAHARRYFIKAMLNDKQGSNQALSMFQSLYEIERTAKDLGLPCNEIQLMREQEAKPLLETFHCWLQKQYACAQPKSSFGKALFYCLNNWEELNQYITDGELSIDNNHSEREMKYIAMGRKAWLFYGSDKGGNDHAIVLSILSTCRRHGVEPWSYLTDVIQRLTENPSVNLEELLPYNWKQKYPAKSPNFQSAEITGCHVTPKVNCA